MNGIKLIAFDLDGVLVDGRGSWAEVHKGLGTLKQSELNGKEYFSGRITFDEWAERDVTLWEGVDIERIKDILYSAHLMTGIDETLHNLKRNYRLAIISGGLKILADYL
ncbi:MAG: HAD-IB family phosphatase, partial [Candidatus Altiarchaeota archaeon]|nr:HAD-IB family phosphatase [Candidatus Altiarchaeota archaeon]